MTDNNGQIIVHPEVDYDYIKVELLDMAQHSPVMLLSL